MADFTDSDEGQNMIEQQREDARLDDVQPDAKDRAAADHEREQVDEDASRAALEMLHGDGEDE